MYSVSSETHTCDVCGFEAKTRKGLFMHVRVHNGGEPLRMPCPVEGDPEQELIRDYKRHCARGERACSASRAAWRRQYHRNQAKKGTVPDGCIADLAAPGPE